MTSSRHRHLVTVWNPSYAKNAMEEHLAILLGLARRAEADELDDDDLYVWWGKVRSSNRQQPQAHLDDLRAIERALSADDAPEVQLYLTDYQSLYVGDILEIVEGELPDGEEDHVPGYYRAEPLNVDVWFKLADIRRIVANDLGAVIEELKLLRNVHYADRPVSLYGGMVDLPLIVTRPDGRRFFDAAERDAMTGGPLWAEFDAESGAGTAAMERELRENVLGATAWGALDSATRTFIATGESVFRTRRDDPAFDFAPVLGSFAKALEVQINLVLRSAVAKLPSASRHVKLGDRTVDLLEHRPLSLGELARAIGGERALNEALRTGLANGGWFATSLPAILGELCEVRNPGTHEARVDRRTATHWRDRLLGVGSVGDFVELSKVKPRPGPGSNRSST